MLQSTNLNENQIKETYFTYSLSPINFILLFSLIHGEDRFEKNLGREKVFAR